jgi:hypothetical protein
MEPVSCSAACMYQLAAEMSTLPLQCVIESGPSTECGIDCGAGADSLTEKFASAGILSPMTHKEQLLSREELAGLHKEQSADFDGPAGPLNRPPQRWSTWMDMCSYVSLTLCGMLLQD